jgi:hypothetical protein
MKHTKEKASAPTIKSVELEKGSQDRECARGEGENSEVAMLQAADGLMEAGKMQTGTVTRGNTSGPSLKK